MKKNKVCFLIPFFGKLNPLFTIWQISASKSKLCDFFIFSDQNIIKKYDNIKIFQMTLKDFENLANSKLEINEKIKTGPKTTDYRPAYGIIFDTYIHDYLYWGYCDMDVILGDIDSYLINIIGNYDKCFYRGHMSIYKNTAENNKRFLLETKKKDFLMFKDAIKIDFVCCFEEYFGVGKLYDFFKFPTYNEYLFEDVNVYRYNFATKVGKYTKIKKIYQYLNNKLYIVFIRNNKLVKEEIMYIHLQKRNMKIECNNFENFVIIPNKIINISEKMMEKNFKKYTKGSLKYFIKQKIKYKYGIKKIITDYKNGKYIWKKLI